MDLDTLDATQAIYHEEFDDETDEDSSASQRKPVAYLVVQEQKGLQNKEYPVYEGDNIIGRQESCQICIPSKSLSKEHACITVKSGSHLIFDKGSRNKTKRGQLFLSPEVRYELKDKNELVFADVKCTYSLVSKNETGGGNESETEEETLDSPKKAKSAPEKDENSNKQTGALLCPQSEEEDYASDASSDILQPTQPYNSAPVGLPKIVGATLVLPESGSETDDECVSDLPAQTLVFHDDDDDDKTENESLILGAATQAIDNRAVQVDETQVHGSDEEDRMSGSDVDMEAATQAIRRGPSPKSKGKHLKKSPQKSGQGKRKNTAGKTKGDREVEKTQAYEMDIDSDSNSTDTKDRASKAKSETLALAEMETQKMEGVNEVDSDNDNKTEKARSPKRMKVMTTETQKIEDVGDIDSNIQDLVSAKKSKTTKKVTRKTEEDTDDEGDTEEESKSITTMETQKMDAAAEDSDEEKNEDDDPHLSGFFCMSTLACEVSDEESDNEGKDVETKVTSDDATQAIGDTVAFEDEEEEPCPKKGKMTKKTPVTGDGDATAPLEDATMPVGEKVDSEPKGKKAKRLTGAADATVPIDASDATMPISAGDATMPINATDATMPISANDATMPISANDATMPISANDATMPISANDATVPIDSKADDPTMAVEETAEDATMPIGDKMDDATMPVDDKTDDATMPMDDRTENPTMPIPDKTLQIESTTEDPTLPIGEDTATVPISDTVVVSDTVPVPDTVAVLDTLPVSDTGPPKRSPTRGRKARKPPPSTADTLPVTDLINEGTQEFGRGDATLPVREEKAGDEDNTAAAGDETAAGDTVLMDEDASLPLFLPQITRSSDVSDDDSTQEMVPESQHEEDSTSLIKLPERSPFKSALVDPTARSRSPSPKRVAFVEPEEPEEEPPQQTAGRGRKKGPASTSEPSTSALRKGRGRGARKRPTTDISGDDILQDETKNDEAAASLKSGSTAKDTYSGKDSAELPADQKVPGAEGKDRGAKRGAKTAAPKALASTPEPRRSGRARKSKRFADDSEEEKEEAEKEGEQKDGETAGVKPGPPTSDDAKDDESPALVGEKMPEVCPGDEPGAEDRESVQADKEEQKTEGRSVTKRSAGIAGPSSSSSSSSSSAQKRAGSRDIDNEQATKKAKQSSDAAADHHENTEETEEETTTTTEEVPDEETPPKGGRSGRKSGRRGAVGGKVQEVETTPGEQVVGRSRGRASLREDRSAAAEPSPSVAGRSRRQTEAVSDDKSDGVGKGKRGSRAVKRSAERVEEATAPDESQEHPVIVKKSRKSTAEEVPATDKTSESDDDSKRTRATRGKVNVSKDADAASTSQRSTKGSSKMGEEPETGIEPSPTRKMTSRPQTENVTEAEESSQGSAVKRRGRRGQKAQSPETDQAADTVMESSSPSKRRGRGKQKEQETDEEQMAEKEESSGPRATGSVEKEAVTGRPEDRDGSDPSGSKKDKTKETPEAESIEMAESSAKARGRTQKSSKSKKEVPENSQSEHNSPSLTGRRGRHQGKSASKEEEASTVETAEEKSSSDPTPSGRGRRTKTQPDTTEDKDSQDHTSAPRRGRQARKLQPDGTDEKDSEDSVPASRETRNKQPDADEEEDSQSRDPASRRGRQAKKTQSDSAEDSQDHDPTPRRGRRGRKIETAPAEETHSQDRDPTPRRGRQTAKIETAPAEETHSQDRDPTPRRGRQTTETDPETKGEQIIKDSTVTTKTSQQTKKAMNKDTNKVSEHGQEEVSQDATHASRGRRAKKADSTEKDLPRDRPSRSTTPSHSQDSQESVTPQNGRRGKKSQNTDVGEPNRDSGSATGRESKRGGKRRAAESETSSDITEPGTASDSPTPQKRGRKGKKAEDLLPTEAGQKSEADSVHSPSLRRSSMAVKPKIIFTGVIDEHGQKIVKELGGEMAQSVQECTHLVTDKIRRTVKFLGGVARGVNIVTLQWLESCKSSGMFVDPSRFIVQDTSAEKQYKFSLRSSLQKAAQSPMLEGYRVHVTKSVRPEPQQMKEILLCAGAEWVASMPKKAVEKTVVISCEEDKNACQVALNAGVDVVSAEFILTGILRQEVDVDGFRLFGGRATSSRSRR